MKYYLDEYLYNILGKDKNLLDDYIDVLNEIKLKNNLDLKLVCRIFLEVIVVCKSSYIQDYLLEKLKYISNNKTLELILLLAPILSKYSDEEEFVKVIDSLEDKEHTFTKKLVIDLNKD